MLGEGWSFRVGLGPFETFPESRVRASRAHVGVWDGFLGLP